MGAEEERRARLRTAFGRALSARLPRGAQTKLAATLGVHSSYISNVFRGHKPASPRFVEATADALGVDDATRAELHRAAAIDNGFKLDLMRRVDPTED